MPDEARLIGAVSLLKPRRIKHLVVAVITLPLKSGFEKRVSLTRDRGFGFFSLRRDFIDGRDGDMWGARQCPGHRTANRGLAARTEKRLGLIDA
jgi:hypothetical protein